MAPTAVLMIEDPCPSGLPEILTAAHTRPLTVALSLQTESETKDEESPITWTPAFESDGAGYGYICAYMYMCIRV